MRLKLIDSDVYTRLVLEVTSTFRGTLVSPFEPLVREMMLICLFSNPVATQAAISANKNEALGRAEDAADSLKGKAQAGAAALSANAHEAASRLGDKAQQVKDDVKGPFDEEKKAIGLPGASPVEALIKNSWVDFKLEKVEPYNHNTKM